MTEAHFLRVKHPTALYGELHLDFNGKKIKANLEDGEFYVTPEMGGESLVRYLVSAEGFIDISNRAPIPNPVNHSTKDKSTSWELKKKGADEKNPESGCVAVNVDGKDVRIPMVRNIVRINNKRVKDFLLSDGFVIVQSYETDFVKGPIFPIPSDLQKKIEDSNLSDPKRLNSVSLVEKIAQSEPQFNPDLSPVETGKKTVTLK